MMGVILTKTLAAPPFNKKEVLRYLGAKEAQSEILSVIDECAASLENKLCCKLCYMHLPLNLKGEFCTVGGITVRSRDLAENLSGCSSVIIFAATVGVEIDRLIAKYGNTSPVKALVYDAIGDERIEAFCNAFCSLLKKERGFSLRPRFSPGYGDLPLNVQNEIFAYLDCPRKIGLTLNDSMLMSPSKSVTAFVGII